MLLDNLLESTIEYYDNYIEYNSKKFNKWLVKNESINQKQKQSDIDRYIPYYDKNNKLIAKMHISLIYRYISETNTIYWRFSDIIRDKDYSMKGLWDYAYHLDSKEFGFIRLLLLNSGLNIKNKETFFILNSIICYILKVGLLFTNIKINKNGYDVDIYDNLNEDIDFLYNNNLTYCYGITKIEILDKKNNKFITALEKGRNKINLP